jgi:type VI protein secretion system component VasF
MNATKSALTLFLLTACATAPQQSIETCSQKVKRLKPESTSAQRYVFCELLDESERATVDQNWDSENE